MQERRKLLLVHHFPLTNVTGVTVMIGEMLKRVPRLAPTLDIAYLSYTNETAAELERRLDADYDDVDCVVGVNLHIEVKWELSEALARWCARKAVPLYDNVQDYWRHHFEYLRVLTGRYGVLLVASSPFIRTSIEKEGFASGDLPMGAQLPQRQPELQRPSHTVVGSVGRLVQRKRFADIARGFRLARLGRSAELRLTLLRSWVFDDAMDDEQLRLVRAEIDVDGAEASKVSIQEVPKVPPEYSSWSSYVCASDYEGFSMTPYEATYMGCPAIMSDIPPHRLMASSLFGEAAEEFLFPTGDAEALATRLSDEAASGRRRAYLQARLPAVRKIIEKRFSVDTTARALVQLCSGTASP